MASVTHLHTSPRSAEFAGCLVNERLTYWKIGDLPLICRLPRESFWLLLEGRETGVSVSPLLRFAAANVAVGVNQLAYPDRRAQSPGMPEDDQ